jgi:hypothetical protein
MRPFKYCLLFLCMLVVPSSAQTTAPRFTIDQVLSAAFPYNLVSARTVDRIAWVENERGLRNVYTAVAPGFTPVRLTSVTEDDGVDLRPMQISRSSRSFADMPPASAARDEFRSGWPALSAIRMAARTRFGPSPLTARGGRGGSCRLGPWNCRQTASPCSM